MDTDGSHNLKNFIGSAKGGLTSFLGIPFAKPPYVSASARFYQVLTLASSTGSRRFRLPEPNDPYNGTFNVASYGPSCPQQDLRSVPPEGLDPQVLQFLLALSATGEGPESEDCAHVHFLYSSRLDPQS